MRKSTAFLATILSLSLVSCGGLNNTEPGHKDPEINKPDVEKPDDNKPGDNDNEGETEKPENPDNPGGNEGGETEKDPVIDKNNEKVKATYEEATLGGYKGTYEEWLTSIKNKDEVAFNAYKHNHPEYTHDQKTWIKDLSEGNLPILAIYTVKFDTKTDTKIDDVRVLEGTPVTKPTDPTRNGYTFDGWTLDGSAYDFESKVKTNITLVAKWLEPNLGETEDDAISVNVGTNDVLTQVSTNVKYLKFEVKNDAYYSFKEFDQIESIYTYKVEEETKSEVNVTLPTSENDEILLSKGVTYFIKYTIKDVNVKKVVLNITETAVLHSTIKNEEFKVREIQTESGVVKIKAHAYVLIKATKDEQSFSFKAPGISEDATIKFSRYDLENPHNVTIADPTIKGEERIYVLPERGDYTVEIYSSSTFNLKLMPYGYESLDEFDMYKQYNYNKHGTYNYRINLKASGAYKLVGTYSDVKARIFMINRNYNLKDKVFYDTDQYKEIFDTDGYFLLNDHYEYVLQLKTGYSESNHMEFKGIEDSKSFSDFEQNTKIKHGVLSFRHYECFKRQDIWFESTLDERYVYEIVNGQYVPVTNYTNRFDVYRLEKGHHYLFCFYTEDFGAINNRSNVKYWNVKPEEDFNGMTPSDYACMIHIPSGANTAYQLTLNKSGYYSVNAPVINNFKLYEYTIQKDGEIPAKEVASISKDANLESAIYKLDSTKEYALFYENNEPAYHKEFLNNQFSVNFIGEKLEGYQMIHPTDISAEHYNKENRYKYYVGQDNKAHEFTTTLKIKILNDGRISFDNKWYRKNSAALNQFIRVTLGDNFDNITKPNPDYPNDSAQCRTEVDVVAGDIIYITMINNANMSEKFYVDLFNLKFTPKEATK